jgi:ADP-ribose pyrophosphatase YjhB (NUDIX family)
MEMISMVAKTKLLIGAFIEKDGKILLVKNKGEWDLPTSTLDKGINILNDLKRDVKALTGLNVEAESVVGIYENLLEENVLVRIYFKTKLLDGEVNNGEWFSLDDIYKLTKEEVGPIMDVVDSYRLEKFVPLKFIEKFKGV